VCLDLLLCSLPCLALPRLACLACLHPSLPALHTCTLCRVVPVVSCLLCRACCVVHVCHQPVCLGSSASPCSNHHPNRHDEYKHNVMRHQLQHRPGGKSPIERCNGLRTCPAPSTQPQRPSTTEFLHTTTDSKLKTKNTNTTT
jgi:hypothetical protein